LLAHCERGDEYIVGQQAHTYKFEGGGAAVVGSIQPQPLDFEPDGSLDLGKVEAAIKPDDPHFARTRLLCLENTQGGRVLPLDYSPKVLPGSTVSASHRCRRTWSTSPSPRAGRRRFASTSRRVACSCAAKERSGSSPIWTSTGATSRASSAQ